MERLLERRRAPRGHVDDPSWLAMPSTWRVQLIDVSLGGVAFASPYALEPGRTLSIRSMVGRDAVNAQIRVCWSRRRCPGDSTPADYEVGAAFVSLEDCSRRALSAFLRLSPSDRS
jgi:hypothetical protein